MMSTSTARRHNVTGIPMLSIGTTKNDRGYILNRYCVNFKDENGKPCSASFYFGKSKKQFDAYVDACDFLMELGEEIGSKAHIKKTYADFNHESLID